MISAKDIQYLGKFALATRSGEEWCLGSPQIHAGEIARKLMPLVDRFVYNCGWLEIIEGKLPNKQGSVAFKGFKSADLTSASCDLEDHGFLDQAARSDWQCKWIEIGTGQWNEVALLISTYEVEAVREVLERLSPFNSRLGEAVPVRINGELLKREAPTPEHPLGSLKIKSRVAVPAAA